MRVDNKLKNYVMFYLQGTMIQSTINSQCGLLQSGSSHAIKSKFQAWFSSRFIVVSPSMHFQSVMSVWLSGYEMDKINPGVHEYVYQRERVRESPLRSCKVDLLCCFKYY